MAIVIRTIMMNEITRCFISKSSISFITLFAIELFVGNV